MAYVSLVEPALTRPKSQARGPAGAHGIIRDQFPITTWLAFGALAQGILLLLAGRLALLPVAAYLAYRTADTWAMAKGWKRNSYMDGVIPKKTSAQMPDETGGFSGKPADSQIVVFLIGTRNNHPLGLLAPGFKQLGEYFQAMSAQVSDRAEEFDFLAQTSWINSNQRTAQNELLNVIYFKSYEGLHKYAHSELHRQGWKWFNDNAKQYPHLSIYHETFVVPKGHWETIYGNSHVSHFASSAHRFIDKETGEVKFASPIVDAGRGPLRTSKGRMARTDGSENDGYEPSALL